MDGLIVKIRKISSNLCLRASETNSPRSRSYPGDLGGAGNDRGRSTFRGSTFRGSAFGRRSGRRTFKDRSNHGHTHAHNTMLQGVMTQETTMTTALDTLVQTIHKGDGVPKDVRTTKQLGKGGFGEVWLATGTIDGVKTKIALKQLKSPLLFRPNSKDAERVLKDMPFSEAAIQSLLVHSNIVRTFGADIMIVDPNTNQPLNIDLHAVMAADKEKAADSGEAGNSSGSRLARSLSTGGWTQVDALLGHTHRLGLPEEVGLIARIAMEYCNAGSMLTYLPRGPGKRVTPMHLSLARGMDLTLCSSMTARDIARGLKLLHKSRIIHGDLKPHNILLALDPQDPRGFIAKVSDFGLSAYLRKGEDQISNITCGSIPYMAPESLERRALTKMSDVYGFGILMWELWHGDFWGIHHAQELQHRKGFNPKINAVGMTDFKPRCDPACPEQYAQLVSSCLESDPLQRPTMKAITMQLENYVEEMLKIHRR